MEAIKDTLRQVLESLTANTRDTPQDKAEGGLKKILTKKELRHIKVHCFRAGTIAMHVDSSAWLYHFTLKKPALLAGLREAHQDIQDIRFYIGESEAWQPKKHGRKEA